MVSYEKETGRLRTGRPGAAARSIVLGHGMFGGLRGWRAVKLGAAAKFVGRSLAIGAVEFLITGHFAPLRRLARVARARDLAKLAPHFDRETYLRQIRSKGRRTRAAADPLLHYLLLGWREARSPNLRFDPIFRGDDMRAGAHTGEPLLHLLSAPDSRTEPQNEIEAAAGTAVESARREGAALIFHHGRGGGSSRFLATFEAHLRAAGIDPLRLRLLPKSDRLVVWPGREAALIDIIDDMPAAIAEAKNRGITHVVISHVIDFDSGLIFERLDQLVRALDVRLWIILHDYLCVCPRVTLVDGWGRPCAIPAPADCVACVAKGGAEIGQADPARWRPRFLRLLERADRIIVPSADARDRLSRFVPKPIEVWAPEKKTAHPEVALPQIAPRDPLVVAIIGSLNEAKGSRVVLDLARLVARRRAPIRLDVYGETDVTRKLRAAGVRVRGRYRADEIGTILSGAAPHLVLMPAIWPETWSFVLTTALERGFPVVAFAHGAQSERLRDLGRQDMLMPIEWYDRPTLILEKLLAFRASHVSRQDPASALALGRESASTTSG